MTANPQTARRRSNNNESTRSEPLAIKTLLATAVLLMLAVPTTAIEVGPVTTNVDQITAGAVTSSLTPGSLAFVQTTWGDEVLMGDQFTAGFSLAIDPNQYLPVDVTLSGVAVQSTPPMVPPVTEECTLDASGPGVTLGDGTPVTKSADGKYNFRLWPNLYAGVESGQTRRGAGTPSDAIVKITGVAPTRAGTSDDPVLCPIGADLLATEVGGLDAEKLVANMLVKAFPELTAPLVVGDVVGDEYPDGDYGTITITDIPPFITSSANPFVLYGATASTTYYLVTNAAFTESDSNTYDDDYMTVRWDGNEKLHVDSVAQYAANAAEVSDGQTAATCLHVKIYDEDWNRGGQGVGQNNDDLIAHANHCWYIAYEQIDSAFALALLVPLDSACTAVANWVKLGGSLTTAQFLQCRDQFRPPTPIVQPLPGWNRDVRIDGLLPGDGELADLGHYKGFNIPLADGSGVMQVPIFAP